MAVTMLRAMEPFVAAGADGIPVTVRTGDLFASDHPVVAGRAHLFAPILTPASQVTQAVEVTTAGPGEARGLSRRVSRHGGPMAAGATAITADGA